jgi:4-amino-4-deoxy-L-arabinose transferase-like glycosyltransferase
MGKLSLRFSEVTEGAPAQLSKRWQLSAVFCIVLFGFIARIATIQSPHLDRTLWKEIDYIEISKNYAAHGMHFLQPEITWPAEEPRITAMEFPAVPYAAATLYKIFGFHAGTVRVITLIAFLLMPVYLFFLVRDEMGPVTALTTALVAALMPIHHPFGRILFSEPVSISMSVAALFHFNRWAKLKQFRHAMFAVLTFTLAVAVKFEPLFMLLPLTYVWWRYRGVGKSLAYFVVFVAASLVIPVCWFFYAYHLSQTSIDVFGVVPFIRGHNKLQTFTMIRQIHHFWLALGHRIWTLCWGVLGVPFVLAGVLVAWQEKRARLFLVYSLAIACYFLIVAEGQIDAQYRQLNAVPVLSFFFAVGVLSLVSLILGARTPERRMKPLMAATAVVILIVFLPSFWTILREDPKEPAHPRAWALAQVIRSHSVPGDRIVALGEYTAHVGGNDVSPVLYNYSGRQGWTLNEDELSERRIDDLISKHATLLAVDDEFVFEKSIDKQHTKAFIEGLMKKYPVLYHSGDGLLLQLAPAATYTRTASK